MLVKLGDVWVDPPQVVYISPSDSTVDISIRDDGYIGGISVASVNSLDEAKALCEEYAAIVNEALSTQSFGAAGETGL